MDIVLYGELDNVPLSSFLRTIKCWLTYISYENICCKNVLQEITDIAKTLRASYNI